MAKPLKLFLLIYCLSVPSSTAIHAEKGYLYLTSTPDSAIVTIDGVSYESLFTPVLCTLSVGSHEIGITKKYYTVQKFNVIIQPEVVIKRTVAFVQDSKRGTQSPGAVTVPSKYGRLTFITNPLGASIIADGKKLGKVTPITLYDIPAGKHDYSILYHYLKYDTTIEITGESPLTAMIDFNEFTGDDIYSIMPHVTTKVVIVVPGCNYKQDETTGALLIKGVDAEINIRTGDTTLSLTHRELADFPATDSATLAKKLNEKRLPQTEYTYYFEPYIDAQLRFDIRTFTNNSKASLRDSARVQSYFHNVAASLNAGDDVNVRIYIEEDGDILFRFW